MLIWVTKKEYRKLKEKYLDLQDVVEEKNYAINKMLEEIEKFKKREEEYGYREKLREDEILSLNNSIVNLLDKINKLNVKLAKEDKPKRGRPKKVKKEE